MVQTAIYELWNWILNNPATFSQLLFSGALVAATIAYTIFTRDQTEEMEKSRKVSNQPVVKGGLGLMGPINLLLEIQNTGNSPAHDVDGEFYFKDIDIDPFHFHIPILSSDEKYEFGLPEEGGEEGGFLVNFGEVQDIIEENNSEEALVVETEFENPFGEEYTNKTELDLLSFMDNKSHIIRDGEEKKIRKGIEGIESSLGDIEKKINSGSTSKLADSQLYATVLDLIEENGTIRFNELLYLTGISERKLHNIVYKLEEGGIIETPEDVNPRHVPDIEITYLGRDVDLRAGADDADTRNLMDFLELSDDLEDVEESEVETERE